MSESATSVSAPAARIHFVIRTSEGEEVSATGDPGLHEFIIGRKSQTAVQGNRVFIFDRFMSRRHCRVFWDAERAGWCVQDLDSANGTRLDGATVTEATLLYGGEEVRVGTAVLRLHLLDADGDAVGGDAAGGGAAGDDGVDDDDATRYSAAMDRAHTEFSHSMDDDLTVYSKTDQSARSAPVPDGDDRTVLQVRPEAPEPEPAEVAEQAGPGVSPAASVEADAVAPLQVEASSAVSAEADPVAPVQVKATPAAARAATGQTAPTALMNGSPAEGAGATASGNDSEGEARRAPTDTQALRSAAVEDEAVVDPYMQTVTLSAEKMVEVNAEYTANAPQLDSDIPDGVARDPLVQDLLARQLIDGYQIKDVLREARDLGQTFFRTFVSSEESRPYHGQIYERVAALRGLEVIDDVDRLYDRAEDAHWLSLELAERLGIIALRDRDDAAVHYACADPFDVVARDWVSRALGKPAIVHLAFPTHLQLVIERLRNRSGAGDDEHSIVAVDLTPEKEEEIREHLADADAPQIVDYFIHRASMQGASDIHIEPTEQRLVVRVRVDGVLHQDVALPSAYHAVVVSRLKIMSSMDVAEKRRPQDGRIGVVVRGNPIDVRVSTYPTVYGEKVVMRLLDKNALRPSPETLGLLPRDLRVLKDAIQAPYGLIMLCGPTGSGKTTTLYSCLGAIDKNQKNVLTVEDPVEYRLGGVHQMQVNANIGLTFASGLRTILRQDPDVIMVGECRDSETAGMAIQASLTGHVVFSTIHTNDAIGVVTRLIDMGIEPFLVGSSVSVAIAQRLVRVLCPDCKVSVPGDEILTRLKQDGVSAEKLAQLHIEVDPYLDYAEARGCRQCRHTGYIGRRAVFEVFEIDREIRSLISSPQFTDAGLRDLALRKGMTTLVSHGLKLVEDENTTFSEVIRVLGETN